MKKFIYIFLLSFVSSIQAFAQPQQQWSRTYNGGSTEWFGDMIVDNNGNTYTVGSSTDTSAQTTINILIKYNPAGDTVWTTNFDSLPGYISHINLDPAGNLIICGTTYSANRGLVAKFDSNGNFLWCRTIFVPLAGTYTSSYDLKADASGNIYVASCEGSSLDLIMTKLDPNGNILWSTPSPYTTSNFQYYSVLTGFDIDASGNAYLAGIFTSADSVGPANYNNDYALIKYNSAGSIVWTKFDTAAGHEYYADAIGRSVICSGNHIYVMQPYPSFIPFCTATPSVKIVVMDYLDDGTQNWRQDYVYPSSVYNYPRTIKKRGSSLYIGGSTYKNSTTDFDYLAFKCDLSGNLQWMKKFNNLNRYDALFDLCLDGTGNIYITGDSYNPSDLFSYSRTLACDSSGNLIWAVSGDTTIYNFSTVVQVDQAGGVIIAGGMLDASNDSDLLTIKYNINIGINDIEEKTEHILVYPNPNTGSFIITSSEADIMQLTIFDISGKEILKQTSETHRLIVDINEFKNGYYLFEALLSDKSIKRGKVLKTE